MTFSSKHSFEQQIDTTLSHHLKAAGQSKGKAQIHTQIVDQREKNCQA